MRPNGWVLLPVAAIHWIARTSLPRRRTYAASALAVLAFLSAAALLGSLRRGIQEEAPDYWLRQGTVLWNMTDWRVPMPAEPVDAPQEGWPGALRYVARHPVASSRLALTRMGVELIHVRPFYSSTRNALAAFSVVVFYPFAILAAWRLRAVPLARVMIAIIASHLLIVALTFADWDGRFLLYFLPLVYVFAACDLSERARRLAVLR
jgi:hypothetical protein